MIRTMFPGPYRVPALEFHTRILASNKATYIAYRGPWAVETFVRERMLDVIARRARPEPGRGPAPQPDRRRRAAREHGHRPGARRADVGQADASRRPWRWPTSTSWEKTQGRGPGRGPPARPRASPPTSRPPPARRATWTTSLPGFAALVDMRADPRRPRGRRDGHRPHPAGDRTARATRRRWPSWPPTSSACPIDAVRVSYGDTRTRPLRAHRDRREPVGDHGQRRRPPGHQGAAGPRSSRSPPTCSKRRHRRPRDRGRPRPRGRHPGHRRHAWPRSPPRPAPPPRWDPGHGQGRRGHPGHGDLRRRRGRLGAGHPRLLRRGRPRHRPGDDPPLRRGRGLRRDHQPRHRRRARSGAGSPRASAPSSTRSRPTTTRASSRPGRSWTT